MAKAGGNMNPIHPAWAEAFQWEGLVPPDREDLRQKRLVLGFVRYFGERASTPMFLRWVGRHGVELYYKPGTYRTGVADARKYLGVTWNGETLISDEELDAVPPTMVLALLGSDQEKKKKEEVQAEAAEQIRETVAVSAPRLAWVVGRDGDQHFTVEVTRRVADGRQTAILVVHPGIAPKTFFEDEVDARRCLDAARALFPGYSWRLMVAKEVE
jgi:hypothetical protein